MNFSELKNIIKTHDVRWPLDIMSKHDYVVTGAIDVKSIGWSRTYEYTNPTTGHKITVSRGANTDFWIDEKNDMSGYWESLELHLAALSGEKKHGSKRVQTSI